MSAFVVSDRHINTLVSWASAHAVSFIHDGGPLTPINGNEARIAGILYTANVESVNTRYREDTISTGFVFAWIPQSGPAITILKACNCFDYQACEIDLYDETVAAAIIDGIRREAIRRLPGYEDAPWSIS